MPRKSRIEAPGVIQHVVSRGIADTQIVLDDADRRDFVSRLGRVSERYEWRIHAYCLMDTHVHLIVEPLEPTLGSGMQRLLGGYAFEFNRRRGRYGHVFAGRFSSTLIELEPHALEACAYVVLNPVRAGIVRAPEDWPWSSYRATAGLVRVPPFLETRIVPGLLNPQQGRAAQLYREFVAEIARRPRPGSG